MSDMHQDLKSLYLPGRQKGYFPSICSEPNLFTENDYSGPNTLRVPMTTSSPKTPQKGDGTLFSGPIIDDELQQWNIAYEVERDGEVLTRDQSYGLRKRETALVDRSLVTDDQVCLSYKSQVQV